MSESITQALLELWQLEAVTTALGEQSEPFTRRLYFPCWPDDQLHTMRHNAGAMSVRRSSIAKSLKAHRAVFQQCHPEVKEIFISRTCKTSLKSHLTSAFHTSRSYAEVRGSQSCSQVGREIYESPSSTPGSVQDLPKIRRYNWELCPVVPLWS